MGVMSGTLDLVQRSYAGCHVSDGVLHFEPRLADHLDGLMFSMQFQGMPLHVLLEAATLSVVADPEGQSRPVRVGVGTDVRVLRPGDRATFALNRETAVRSI